MFLLAREPVTFFKNYVTPFVCNEIQNAPQNVKKYDVDRNSCREFYSYFHCAKMLVVFWVERNFAKWITQ